MKMSNEQSEQELLNRYDEICSQLNLDQQAAKEALASYQRIRINYTLEGNKLHWLACALYVACRNGTLPTVGGDSDIQGNCVSLTMLLRLCRLSLVEFFNKMKKWSEMANSRHEMRNKLEHLERNFNVSTNIFMKMKPIFMEIFKDPSSSPSKTAKTRKQGRKQTIAASDIFSFCWSLFIHVKSKYSAISDDIVNSYHLLLACIDFCYSNALVAENAKDLLNPTFSCLPENFNDEDFQPPETVPCIMQTLCKKFGGIKNETKGIKEHWFKPSIKRMVERHILKCRNPPTQLLGFFDAPNFDHNLKSIIRNYDQYVLSIGDFDERIFLNDNAHEALGTPDINTFQSNEINEELQMRERMEEARSVMPNTPLSNRLYLRNREQNKSTPVTNATQTVARLQSLVLGRENKPGPLLVQLYKELPENPHDTVIERIKELGDKFLSCFTQSNEDTVDLETVQSIARKRLDLAVTFYYKMLEKIMLHEKSLIQNQNGGSFSQAFLKMHFNELFHVGLFACSVEIVLFSYSSKRLYPWILDILSDFRNLNFQPFYFYKVFELLIRQEDGLSRDVVKHLNSIEEQILDSESWKSDSVLWKLIDENGGVPSCQSVASSNTGNSPPVNPVVGNIIPASPCAYIKRINREANVQSPLVTGTAFDRFESPARSIGDSFARRRLFPSEPNVIQIIQIPFNVTQAVKTVPQAEENATVSPMKTNVQPKPDSLTLFFRKVYNLTWLRLCEHFKKLDIENDDYLKRKIWTCMEVSIREHTELLKDRHLDQLIMCALYSICKTATDEKKRKSFKDILGSYRQQPQAKSHVYRSVLLTRKRRNSSNSDAQLSASNSPTTNNEERMRSSSTLPISNPNSQPPTPTCLNNGSQFEFNDCERSDLITFYNNVYVPSMEKFVMNFLSPNTSPKLSPYPKMASNHSTKRIISTKHSLYISPMKPSDYPSSPKRPMTYCFHKSPAKDLRAINTMLRSTGSENKGCKRLLSEDVVDGENSPIHQRLIGEAHFHKKIKNLLEERDCVAAGNDTENE